MSVSLIDLFDEVSAHRRSDALLGLVQAKLKEVHAEAERLIDAAGTPETVGRFIAARDYAEQGMTTTMLSSTLMGLCRAESRLAGDGEEAAFDRARQYMLSVLPAVDALAILVREAP